MKTFSALLVLAFASFSHCVQLRTVGSFYIGESKRKLNFQLALVINTVLSCIFAAFFEPPNTRMMVKKYYLTKIFRADWMGAFNFCKNNGMELANFRNKNDFDNFTDLFVGDVTLPEKERIYIDGLGNLDGNAWHYFESGKLIDFALPWRAGEPNNAGGSEFCTEMSFSNGFLGLNDYDCRDSLRFICQEILPM